MYTTGTGLPQDDEQAYIWLERASDAGNLRAKTSLAAVYQEGRGVAQDLAAAATLFEEAARAGDPAAAVLLGRMLADDEVADPPEPSWSARYVAAAAREGSEAARAWLQARADAGGQHAMGRLAELMLDSPEQAEAGVALYEAAAAAGDLTAQLEVGRMYSTGDRLPLDYVRAYGWLNVAATFGQPEANRLRDVMTSLMTSDQIAEGQALSRAYFEAEADRVPQTDQSVVNR
jgi:hypothetical protein